MWRFCYSYTHPGWAAEMKGVVFLTVLKVLVSFVEWLGMGPNALQMHSK